MSDFVLDQLVVGRIRDSRLDDHLARCDRCAGRLALLQASHRLASPAIEQILAAAQRRVARAAFPPKSAHGRGALVRLLLGTLAAAGVAAGIVLSLDGEPPAAGGVADGLRLKGAGLRFFVQRRGAVMAGESGAAYRRRDALRFVISNDRPGFFFLVGIEQTGRISAYVPFGGEQSVPAPVEADIRAAFERILVTRDASLEALRTVSLPGRHEWIVIDRE